MTEKTYNDRGPCIKCDYGLSGLEWRERDVWQVGDLDPGLFARCHQCGYEWKVKAKDE